MPSSLAKTIGPPDLPDLLVIARDIRRLDAEAAFGTWAYRIVSHKAADWLRQHVRRRDREARFAAQWQLEGEAAGEPPPEQARKIARYMYVWLLILLVFASVAY